MSQPYVILAESDKRFAAMLVPLLAEGEFRYAHASSHKEARTLATVEMPAVLILDMDQPTRESIRLLMDLKSRGMTGGVLWVSSHVDKAECERVAASGAQGLLWKSADAATTLGAIRKVARGETFFQVIQPARKNSGIRSLSMDDRLARLLQG